METLRLSITTVFARKTILIWVALLLAATLVFPYLTPWEERPSILQPTRAQTAWTMGWLFVLIWGFYQAASFGDQWSSQGILEYLNAIRKNRFSRLAQLWGACMAFSLAFLLLVVVLSLAFAMPSDGAEAWMWICTNFQYAWLFALAMGPLMLLAVALGTRINATAAYCVTAALAIYGLFGVAYLDFFLSQSSNALLDLVYVISPHYHLADLTDRLVFKMGALDTATFFQTSGYLIGLGCVTTAASCALYTEKK